ncbi:MAG TPA: gephyrin-like molybdotransferase Glp [Chloroflexia bacterium]|nr:gephyrin-like molybdotransferase Glp [Chloroflexia bacterium]
MSATQLTSITVPEALAYILGHFAPLPPEPTALLAASGRVLAEDITADGDVPPFANSAMDGYAVRAADTAGASRATPRPLRVIGNVAAGYVTGASVGPGAALRIMTGAPLPAGADAVIRFEETSEGDAINAGASHATNRPAEDAKATWRNQIADPPPSDPAASPTVLLYNGVQPGDNVRHAGEDMRRGQAVLARGTLIRPYEVALLAAVGRPQVLTHRRPRVVLLSTGDELVDVGAPVGPGQIRNSNSYGLAAQVTAAGGVPLLLGIARDNLAELTTRVEEGLAQAPDLFVTSAGVSVGDYDIVKDVLDREGTMHFWQVRMKPGKPLAFGVVRGVPLLGLPGNPVSSLVSFEQFGRPAILKMLGRTGWARPVLQVRATEAIPNTSGREHYIRAVVTRTATGEYEARSTGEQGSGILTSLTQANAMLIVEETRTLVQPGDMVRAIMLDWPEEVF